MTIRTALLRTGLIAALVAPVLPAAAQSLHDTHQQVWAPAGKIPQSHFRPLARNDCATIQRHHQAGKGHLLPADHGRRCVTETAMEDVKPAAKPVS